MSRLCYVCFALLILLVGTLPSCGKAKIAELEEPDYFAQLPIMNQMMSKAAVKVISDPHLIFFSSDPITVNFAEFDLINNKIISEGFTLTAPDGTSFNNIKNTSTAAWKLAVQQHLDIVSWRDSTVVFKYTELPFAIYDCEEQAAHHFSSWCNYCDESDATTLSVSVGNYRCNNTLGTVIVNQPNVHAKLDLKVLLPSNSQQECQNIFDQRLLKNSLAKL